MTQALTVLRNLEKLEIILPNQQEGSEQGMEALATVQASGLKIAGGKLQSVEAIAAYVSKMPNL